MYVDCRRGSVSLINHRTNSENIVKYENDFLSLETYKPIENVFRLLSKMSFVICKCDRTFGRLKSSKDLL
jgi:hypothetical protein